ncbi:MAG TPA: hypothetical protein VFW29_10360, partial [Solirubrobacteraceae bacterium]|nr:hypothetical protein [Solirubrobacteraceae bacterium]
MASLRTRLLAGVLVLAAAGLVLLAVVTYAEQRSFLYSRVDQETRAAVGALSVALDRTVEQQALPGAGGPGGPGIGAGADQGGAGGAGGPRSTPGGPRVNLP